MEQKGKGGYLGQQPIFAKDTYRDYKTSLLSLSENEDQFRSSFNISQFSVTIQ